MSRQLRTAMRSSTGTLLLACLLCSLSTVLAISDDLVIDVTGGSIRGYIEPIFGLKTFKGIPFAAPPVGPLRFKPPQPVPSWSGVRDANKVSAGCMTVCKSYHPENDCAPTLSEDCLYLNVWGASSPTAGPLRPVVLWIHGGTFEHGSAMMAAYDGAGFAHAQDVVFVSTNYRLGLIGGLFIPDQDINGNFMLQDQRVAMQWVQDNIAKFGGDPTRVTIMGESAGAMSVGSHMASPLSKDKGLFSQAIMESNPFGSLMMVPSLATKLAAYVSDFLGCGNGTTVADVECLRSVNSTFLQEASEYVHTYKFPSLSAGGVPWSPVVIPGGDELPEQPYLAAAAGKASKVPLLLGTNANESVMFVPPTPLPAAYIPMLFAQRLGVEGAALAMKLYGPIENKADARLYAARIETDYTFYCSARAVAKAFRNNGVPVYQYLFDHLPSYVPWMYNYSTTALCVHEVCHAFELGFVFNNQYAQPTRPKMTVLELNLAIQMQNAWGNFVRTGSPNPAKGASHEGYAPVPWPPFGDLSFVNIDFMTIPGTHLIKHHHDFKCDLFDAIGWHEKM